MNFYGVAIPNEGNCTLGQIKASSFHSFALGTNGTYSLAVFLNGITYMGSYIKNDNSYSFIWSYNSGVTISPLTVTKYFYTY